MAVDIYNARSATTAVHNGSVVVNSGGRGSYALVADIDSGDAVTTPTITTLASKYDTRFDDVNYYE